jgi:uncharacterized membrane protein YgcG
MKTFQEYYSNSLDTYPYGGASVGPGMGQYVPVADLNLRAQKEKEVKKSDIDQLEKYADRLFGAVGIDVEFTRHFLDRVNDARNKVQITPSELTRLFRQSYKKFGKRIAKLGPDAEAVITDMKTDINMPFVLNLKGGELELIAKTVMRKKDFKTQNPKLAFEGIGEPNIFSQKNPRIPRKKGQPAKSKKHSDLYTDEDPKGTIHGLGFKDVATARASVKKIESSGRTHAHKIQAAIAMEQRARVMGKTAEANVYRAYIEKMKKKTKEMRKEDAHGFNCPPGYKFDKKLMACVPKKTKFKTVYAYPYFGGGTKSGDQSGETQSGQNGNGNGNGGNGNGNGGNGNGGNGGNGASGGESYIVADVRKMSGGGYGVYADKFVKGKRVTLPSGKHAKELKKVYRSKEKANKYMAAIMIGKGG